MPRPGRRQIRSGVDLLPSDLVWIGSAILQPAIGLVLLRRTRPAGARHPAERPGVVSLDPAGLDPAGMVAAMAPAMPRRGRS